LQPPWLKYQLLSAPWSSAAITLARLGSLPAYVNRLTAFLPMSWYWLTIPPSEQIDWRF
jgi:hypothetical protein